MTDRTPAPDAPPHTRALLDSLLPGDITINTRRLIRTRWAAGGLALVATAFTTRVLGLPLPEVALYLVGLAVLAYNALLCWGMRRAQTNHGEARLKRVRRLVVLQVGLDWVAMAAVVHLTGGITSPAIPFFLIHMLMVTILLPGQSPYIYTAMGLAVLVAIALAEQANLLPHRTVIPGLPERLHLNIAYVGAQLGFLTITAFAIVYLTQSILARLEERERQIAALFQTTQAISSTLSLPEVMERLAQSAAEALDMPSASIRLLDESGEQLAMTGSYGLSRDYVEKGPVDLARSPLDEEALRGQPVIIDEAGQDNRLQYPQEIEAEGIRSIVVVPIIGRGRRLGVLRVYSGEPHRFSSTDADFVMAIAQQGATALENALAHEELQKAHQARGQFVRIVTHELRAPVGGAQSLLRTLLRGLAGDLNERQQDMLERMGRRLDALMDLINDLLGLAASKTPELEEAATRLPLQPVIRQVVDRWSDQAHEKGIDLRADLPGEALPVIASEEGLARVFDNLVGNAVKYTPPGGCVTVSVVERPTGAVVSVADTGVGIPEEDLSSLFQEFYRASNARRSEIPGTGLGLSIAKQLVERYGGSIGVQSAEGEGTTFKVTLPIAGPGEPI